MLTTADRLALDRASARSVDQAGHLHVSRNVLSRANVCPYYGREVAGGEALGLDPDRIYQLLRDPAALEASAPTFNGKPLLVTHRPQSASDHDHSITVGALSNVRWEAPCLVGELTVWDGEAIALIESDEQSSLSLGYFYKAVPQSGVLDGVAYSLVMAEIVGNHCALVAEPRVKGAFVGDAALSTTQPSIMERPKWRNISPARPPVQWARCKFT